MAIQTGLQRHQKRSRLRRLSSIRCAARQHSPGAQTSALCGLMASLVASLAFSHYRGYDEHALADSCLFGLATLSSLKWYFLSVVRAVGYRVTVHASTIT